MSKTKRVIAIVLVAALSFSGGLLGGLYAQEIKNALGINPSSVKSGNSYELTDLRNSSKIEGGNVEEDEKGNIIINVSGDYTLAEAIAVKVMPSVVSVTTSYDTSYDFYDFFGWGGGQTQEQSCVGTGIIVDSNGYILTNSHVVNDGSYKKILISLYEGEEYEGTVLWNDASLDIAVVKIDAKGLKAAELGDSDELRIGSYAAAIGNPLGLTFERSMSQGIISGLNRTITVSSSSSSTSGTTMEGLIQTDAAINSGNSGGPLLNSKGQVVGIASARASSGEAMGFAIPINIAKPIINQIKEKGTFERVYMGITAYGVDQMSTRSIATLEEEYGTSSGIYVYTITKGGGADKAGMKAGDIITSVNGTPVATMNKLQSVLVNYVSGDTISVTYLRNKVEHKVDVVLMTEKDLNSKKQ